MHPKKAFFANIILFIISALICLFILELVLRIISSANPFHPALALRPYNKMRLCVDLDGVSRAAIHSTNKWGMRGEEPPRDWNEYYTVVAIGGSTTQCFYLDDCKTWPYLLQGKLRQKYPKVWVGNGGLDGHTTRGHILFMKHVIAKIKPDAVILLTGINDLGLSLNADYMMYGSFFERPNWRRWILAHSRLAQIGYIWKAIIFKNVTVVKKSMHHNFTPKPLGENSTLLPDDFELSLPSLEEYRKNIKEIIKIGRSLGVRVIFSTQPILFDDTQYWRNIEGSFYWMKNMKYRLSAATYWKFLDTFNKELLRICQDEDVECPDLASLIPHSGMYFYDSVHFNERGAELTADKIAEFIINSGMPFTKTTK